MKYVIKSFILTLILILSAFVILMCTKRPIDSTGKKGINLLYLAARNYGLNYFLNRDMHEQYGWNVTYAGVSDSVTACPPVAEQLKMHPIIPGILVPMITDITKYNAIAITPASGQYTQVPNSFDDLRNSPETLKLIVTACEKGIPVSAICSGLRVLAAADVIRGKQVAGAKRFKDEYESAGATYIGTDHYPVMDGNIVTGARDLYYNFQHVQALATMIENNIIPGDHNNHDINKLIQEKEFDIHADNLLSAKTYGGSLSDGGKAVCETRDGGFLITGYTFSHGSGDPDILVIKTDADGIKEWAKSYGSYGVEYGYDCLAIDDGYLITGYTTSFHAQSKDVCLLKIDFNGNQQWLKRYGGESWDVGMAVTPANDGDFFICGFTHSFGNGEEDVYLIKTNKEGDELWSKTYGGNRYEIGNSVYVTPDGGCVIGATTGTFGGKNCDFYLIRTDKNGNELWTKSLGSKGRRGYGYDWCQKMSATEDGGSIMIGHSDCADLQDIRIVKTDMDGNEIWATAIGNKPFYDYGNSIFPVEDDHYVVVGTTKLQVQNKNIYNNDIYIAKLNSKGEIKWETSIGNTGSDWGQAAIRASNGDYVIIGHSNSGEMNDLDVCFIKLRERIPGTT